MFGAIRDSISSTLSAVRDGVSSITKKQVAIGAGVVAAGAAAYFGMPAAIAECLNPTAVCVETSRYFGLIKDTVCTVPTTICQTAIPSVKGYVGKLAAGVFIAVKKATIFALGAAGVYGVARKVMNAEPAAIREDQLTPIEAPVVEKTATVSEPSGFPMPTIDEEEKVAAAPQAAISAEPPVASATATMVGVTYNMRNAPTVLNFKVPRVDGDFKSVSFNMATQSLEQLADQYGQAFADEVYGQILTAMEQKRHPLLLAIETKPTPVSTPVID